MSKICVLGVMGLELMCFGGGGRGGYVDTTCDMRRVELPQAWKDECLDDRGRLRSSLPGKTRQACANIFINNRKLARDCPKQK